MKLQVKRSIVIKASPTKVRKTISDFTTWKSWSPWSTREPKHQCTIEGKAGKAGHSMTWDGKLIGSGKNSITEIDKSTIKYHLEFYKPWRSQADVKFEIKKVKGGSKVIWSMNSQMPFFMFFMKGKMQAWMEMDYDRGLIMLKAIVEEGKVKATTKNLGIKKHKGFSYIGIEKTSTMKRMPKEMDACYKKLMKKLEKEGKCAKHWFSLYTKIDLAKKEFTYICAASDEQLQDVKFDNSFTKGKIKAGKVLEIKHNGSYQFLGNAWSMGMSEIQANKIKMSGKPFEYYWNSPFNTPPEKLKTSIYFPVK